MKKLLLAGVAALFLATGTAHAKDGNTCVKPNLTESSCSKDGDQYESYAQSCEVGQNNVCLTPGAACSRVNAGSGNQGKCKTVGPKGETECSCMGQVGSSQTGIVGNVLSAPIYVNLYWDAKRE